jgi:uncharacterized protein
MHMHWDDLTFIHWPLAPDAVQRLLPEGVRVQTFADQAWVSLVPFVMRVTLSNQRVALPFVGRFPETNVRTYVTADDGTEGIWFFSLDAGSRLATVGGRAGYRLPYMFSSMTVERQPDSAVYTCRRRFPGPRGASSAVAVTIGERLTDDQLGERDHWLSARWRLYSRMFGRVWGAHAEHEPWPLRAATLTRLDDQLVRAAGLPEPTSEPTVQFADRVSVRIGRPYRIRTTPAR